MERKKFIQNSFIMSMLFSSNPLSALHEIGNQLPETPRMPALFIGHGSPMNALEDNAFTKGWKKIGSQIPKPRAILCISAHWETKGSLITNMAKPKTIHDFGGFPDALFQVQYPAPGSPAIAHEIIENIKPALVHEDASWGLDHGCWSVLKPMFPHADIPVLQLSLDYTKDGPYHFELGKQLRALRNKGILIIGSGNMVHNFSYLQLPKANHATNDMSALFNQPFAHPWAEEANQSFKDLLVKDNYQALSNYKSLSKAIQLAIPTPEHYLPMLYAMACRDRDDKLEFFNDITIAGSFSMTSFILRA